MKLAIPEVSKIERIWPPGVAGWSDMSCIFINSSLLEFLRHPCVPLSHGHIYVFENKLANDVKEMSFPHAFNFMSHN